MPDENPRPPLVSDTMAELRRLKAKRTALKGAITRGETFVNAMPVLVESEMLSVRKDKLVSAFKQYEDVNLDILTLDASDNEEIAVTENKYFYVISKLDEAMKRLNKSENDSKQSTQQPQSSSNSKLPNIEIPYFDGTDFTKFKPFMDLFCAVFDQNQSLSNVQKLFYLRKYLRDDALGIIVNMPIVHESYPEAMSLLRKRFENKSRLVSTHINILLDMPSMQRGTAANIRSFISNIQQQLHALKNLDMPIKEWDMILISVLTKKLDTYTNRAYHLDREKPDDMPTMDGLIAFLEKRAIALEESLQEPMW